MKTHLIVYKLNLMNINFHLLNSLEQKKTLKADLFSYQLPKAKSCSLHKEVETRNVFSIAA